MKKTIQNALVIIGVIATMILTPGCGNTDTQTANGNPVTFYEVPLVCGAAPEIGCGSRLKPLFIASEKINEIKESWSNRQGTVLAFMWKDGVDANKKESLIASLFKENDVDGKLLTDEKKIAELTASMNGKDKWYKGMDVDQLSLEEAGVIAGSLVNFGKEKEFLNSHQADSLKTEIEAYFKKELIKVRTPDELNAQDTRERWMSEVGQMVVKYIGKEKTQALSAAYTEYKEGLEKNEKSCCEEKKECTNDKKECSKNKGNG